MHGLDQFEDDTGGTVFRDVTMLALAGFVCIVILLLPHINPKAKTDAEPPHGNILVELRWPDEADADVDLWVEAPGDRPVGHRPEEHTSELQKPMRTSYAARSGR